MHCIYHHTAEFQINKNSANVPKLKVIYKNNVDNNTDHLATFEKLYDNYAPKAYGFIINHTKSKDQAEKYMMNVFLKVWENITTFDHEAEKKIQHIVLTTCKPLLLQ